MPVSKMKLSVKNSLKEAKIEKTLLTNMKYWAKINVSLRAGLAVMICILLVSPAGSYQVGDLLVKCFTNTRLPDYLRQSNWQTIKADENELILKIMTLEPVVRRYEFITHEIVAVSYQPETEADIRKLDGSSPLPQKGTLTNILGLMLQKFIQEGFEIGDYSSFIKIAGVDGYRFELIRPKMSTEQWLKGCPPIKYAWHILIWKKGWYLITYSNFDNAFPGPHFSDFETFLTDLKFVDQN